MQASTAGPNKPVLTGLLLRAFGLDTERLSRAQKLIMLGCLMLSSIPMVRSFADVNDFAGIDLRNRVVGARVMLTGQDPYTFFWKPGMPDTLRDPAPHLWVHRLTAPPTTLWLYAPLAPLPYRAIRNISCLLEWLALAGSLALLVRLVPGSRGRVLFLATAVAFFVLSDFWRMHLERGQLYVFHLLALSAGAYCCQRRNLDSWGAGLAFGIAAAMRPSYALLAPAFLILGKRRTGFGTILVCGAAVLLSAIASPAGSWQSYLRVGNTHYLSIWAPELFPDIGTGHKNGVLDGYDFNAYIRELESPSFPILYQYLRSVSNLPVLDVGMLSKALIGVISLTLLALLWSRRQARHAPRIALALILTLALDVELFLPYRWAYVDVMLLLPLGLLMPRLMVPSISGRVTGGLVLLALVAGYSLSEHFLFAGSFVRAWGVLAALTGLAIWSWVRRPRAAKTEMAAIATGGEVKLSPPVGAAASETALTCMVVLLVILFCVPFLVANTSFFWVDDYQIYQLAGFHDIARAWGHGEFPLLSPYSWSCGALAAEYQFGVFNFFLMGSVLIAFALGLSLPLTAAVLSIIHLAVLAAGAFRLARGRGLSADLSLLTALVGALSGWIFLWGARAWFPALSSFAWFPWFWWALEFALKRESGLLRFLPAGVFLYLIATAGWPFTLLMAGLLTAWLMLRTARTRQSSWATWPAVAAWLVGLGLSAPAWLMLMELSQHTLRGMTPPLELTRDWAVPAASLPGLIFPAHVSVWRVFHWSKPHPAIELTGCFVPLVILAVALARGGLGACRRYRWDAGLCVLALVLSLSPGLGNFRYGFRWLPFFSLALALFAAEALAGLRAPTEGSSGGPAHLRQNLGIWAFCLVAVVAAWGLVADQAPSMHILAHASVLLALCAGWALVEGRWPVGMPLRRWAPCAMVLASCWLAYTDAEQAREVLAWGIPERAGDTGPLDPHVRYLNCHTLRDIYPGAEPLMPGQHNGIGEELFLGNTCMYPGVEFVNGYSPLRPRGLCDLMDFGPQGFMGPGICNHLIEHESARGRLLDLMGVDGLIVANRFTDRFKCLQANGWREVGVVTGGRVFHRSGPPSPRVRAVSAVKPISDYRETGLNLLRSEGGELPILAHDPKGQLGSGPIPFSPARVTIVAESRNSVTVEVVPSVPDRDVLVVFSRPWFPGYRAVYKGRVLTVHQVNLMLPAVRLPAGGSGCVVLEYWPSSLVLGRRIALATGAVALLVLLLAGCRQLRQARSETRAAAQSVSNTPLASRCASAPTDSLMQVPAESAHISQ